MSSRFTDFLDRQQRHSKPVSGSELECFGKSAAADWVAGRFPTVHDAVVSSVKEARLSPEQVRRVVEFANINSYLNLFRKEGGVNKYIDFGEAGPADPSDVLRDLNDGGNTVSDMGGSEKMGQITPEGHHVGQVSEAQLFAALFPGAGAEKTASVEARLASSTAELWDVHTKLSHAISEAQGQLGLLQHYAAPAVEEFTSNIKEATRAGHSLGEIVSVLQQFGQDGHVKSAMLTIMPRLSSEVFHTSEEVAESFRKEASSVGRPDPDHPLIQSFHGLVASLEKLASAREELEELTGAQARVRAQLKLASGGLVGKGWHALKSTADWAGKGGEAAGRALFGGDGKAVGHAARALTYAAPVVAGHEVYRRVLKNSPVVSAARSIVPGTNEYYAAEMDGNPYAMMGGY